MVLKTEAITLNNSVGLLKRMVEGREMGSGVISESGEVRSSINGGGGDSGRDSAAMEEKVTTVREVYEK